MGGRKGPGVKCVGDTYLQPRCSLDASGSVCGAFLSPW